MKFLKDKWKNEGIKEFLLKSFANQAARAEINNIKDYKIKVPLEAIHIIYESTLQNDDIKQIKIYGRNIEFF